VKRVAPLRDEAASEGRPSYANLVLRRVNESRRSRDLRRLRWPWKGREGEAFRTGMGRPATPSGTQKPCPATPSATHKPRPDGIGTQTPRRRMRDGRRGKMGSLRRESNCDWRLLRSGTARLKTKCGFGAALSGLAARSRVRRETLPGD